jgi:tetratricopeptide (TPR) repeat protein
MIVLAWFLVGFLLLRMMVAGVNLLSPTRLPKGDPGDTPLVSVLIPARNEQDSIGSLLESLASHDYENLEVIVYDDLSDDKTAEVVAQHARQDPRIRLIRGTGLPPGWLGKNHACHHLAMEAQGSWLLFLDADVTAQQGLIRNLLARAGRFGLGLLSVFPGQRMETLGEKAVVPLMNWILVSMLPLPLTRLSARPSLSAANGQCMLFHSGTYRQHRFHERVKDQKVEDIRIFRMAKRLGVPAETLLDNGQVSCRMYRSFREAIQGFSKNVFEFFGGSAWLAWGFTLATVLGFVPVWLAMGAWQAAAFVGGGVLIRLLSAWASRQAAGGALLLGPLQQFSLLMVVSAGLLQRVRKSTTWKGRRVDLPRKVVKSAVVLFFLLVGWAGSLPAGQQASPSLKTYQDAIYEAYVLNRMPQWVSTLQDMEAAYRRQPGTALLYDILLAQYGLIGYYLGTEDNASGGSLLDKAEKNLATLAREPGYKAATRAFEGAFLAFRISLRPIRAVQLGPRSYRRIDEAIEADPDYARAWIEKGNAAFFTPPVFGGSKTEAIDHYTKALQLLEARMPNNHRWLYLSTLVSLANAYEKTGDLPRAIRTLEKALAFEPRFTWVRDEMLPRLRTIQQ